TSVPMILNVSVGQLPALAAMRPSTVTVAAVRAACASPTVRPATVTVPVRGAVEALAATSSVPALEPAPCAVATTTIHGTFETAVHVQLVADAVTVTSAWPPSATTICRAGATSNEHGGGSGVRSCVTENGWPATSTLPVRVADAAFSATATAMSAGPVPDDGPTSVSHGACGVAVHGQ